MPTPKKRQREIAMEIPRYNEPEAKPTNEKAEPQSPPTPSTGGIALASAETEKDPFKLELKEHGYIILQENEFGVIARKTIGKPTFLPLTKDGYLSQKDKKSFMLPTSPVVAMKVRAANLNITIDQYVTQLIMKDLKENGIEY